MILRIREGESSWRRREAMVIGPMVLVVRCVRRDEKDLDGGTGELAHPGDTV